jgi:FkbM family methyltransferase
MTTATATPFAATECRFFADLRDRGFAVDSIFDIGGSNGAWSTAMVEVFPNARFDLFEPLATQEPEYTRVLEWAKDQHRFHVHAIALGAEAGNAAFWKAPWAVGSSLLARHAPASEVMQVPVERLDDYRRQHSLPQPQLIKMDVQGGELLVLQGGTSTVREADALHVETWLGRGYGSATPLLPEVMDFLRPLDHVLVHLGDFWRRPDQELFSVDAFFVHRRLIERIAAAGKSFPWPQNWTPEG